MIAWFGRRAEDVLSALLLAMFVAFMLQIVTRYVLNAPLSWTAEMSTLAWVWGILWGAGLVLRDEEEIRFDVIYALMSGPVRRICDGISSGVVVIVFTWSLPAMVDYVTFMKVERSAYLGIRFDLLYSVYLIFAVAMIVRHGAIVWRAMTGRRLWVSA
ncbi:TRAP transporter small permease subunit [Roseomonas terrae]|jgi:TRAP-type C4-dicarboxylate transport system permease small subunit|uniref:TRAP transporter small permease protein n=1 Tax=Neoroseomonas terrae TaxID=424799 RepID=A0ABS5EQH4_9PROT|nr:TRAP transporter small permease subunit [Neoroseomonas terrae]MBR0653251.1 TRAP transporter small permease subunit [Neoroseomonas terrae]